MKRITLRLIIAILTFLIGMAAAYIWIIKRHSNIDRTTAGNVTAEAPKTVCDLVGNPDAYLSKIVHVRATLNGYHETALYDSACINGERYKKYILADFDASTRDKLAKAIAALDGRGLVRGNIWANVTLAGRFEKNPSGDCVKGQKESGMPNRYYITYCYGLVVSDGEHVEAVSPSASWPEE